MSGDTVKQNKTKPGSGNDCATHLFIYPGAHPPICPGDRSAICSGVSPPIYPGACPHICPGAQPAICPGVHSPIYSGARSPSYPPLSCFLHWFQILVLKFFVLTFFDFSSSCEEIRHNFQVDI